MQRDRVEASQEFVGSPLADAEATLSVGEAIEEEACVIVNKPCDMQPTRGARGPPSV